MIAMMYHAWRRPGRKPRPDESISIQRLASRKEGKRTAKRNVDDAVGAADALLYPDRERRENDGNEAEAEVTSTHDGL